MANVIFLDIYFLKLKVKTMECKQCNQQFKIYAEDKEFLARFEVPEPSYCPDCRAQQRFAFRNERFLYPRECALCKKKVISVFSEDKDYVVYCQDCWYSDKWDARDYGLDYDDSKPFFEQVNEVMHKVPFPALVVEAPTCINSDYVNDAAKIKNCYLTFDVSYVEDSYYGETAWKMKNCMDFLNSFDCEVCYEITYCTKCYNLNYSQYCSGCFDSYFLLDCVGCNNCFGCCNLVNAKHCIWNEQYTEEEYKKKIAELKQKIKKPEELEKIKNKFSEFSQQFPKRATRGIKNQNSLGDNINYCKNCFHCFDTNNSENCRYAYKMMSGCKDCMDVTIWGEDNELCYNSGGVGMKSYNNICCHYAWQSASDLTYCYFCYKSVKDLLGCVCMRGSQHCILNKQYSEKEYFKLKDKIISELKQQGVYGDFLPALINPFAYNETQAQEYYPLKKEQAEKLGYTWTSSAKATEVKKDKDIYACTDCGKSYKLIIQEKKIYQERELAEPKKCSDCRHLDRIKYRNPNKFWERECDKCQCTVQSTYSLDRPEKIYCEQCYQKEIY